MRIKITADSTCDLPKAWLEENDVDIMPLYIIRAGASYQDGVDIFPEDIFRHVAAGGDICTTASINAADYEERFARWAAAYDAVIHVNLGSGFSSCHQNARIAAASFDNVYPVDSQNLSSGMGQMVWEAKDLAAKGLPPAEILERLEETAPKIEASFVLNSLDYLAKGGRCSSVLSLGGNLLNLKPCIEVADGAMRVGKKYRGSFERAMKRYLEDRLGGREDIREDRVILVHTGCPAALVEYVRGLLRETAPRYTIVEATAGCTISNHCGPNTMGLMYVRK